MSTQEYAVRMLGKVNIQEITPWYRNSITQDSDDRRVQKVKVLLTKTQNEKENHGDRAALIVISHVSGAVLFQGIIEDKWFFYDDSETRDVVHSTRSECSLGIPDMNGEAYDGHNFEFENDADYTHFRDFLLGGQESSKLFQQAWRDTLITGVLESGDYSEKAMA
ncbi:hypothetical protein K466DRAFT_605390 [Polyporus arcularius HHB13444]|uniref:Uncharacterized protein n=1 Tax=Polyporus arcularius HHB13444 TaxID=1314778 RepID=A0A5C3NS66_9APHY|nr:hypothetical protein K466DRAFT_605390 [Polyporus arcularius HHB13444]